MDTIELQTPAGFTIEVGMVEPPAIEISGALTGPTGEAATIAVGSTATGSPGTLATVTNSGTANDAILDFTIPRGNTGATGAPGAAATIAVGTVTTLSPGSPVSVVNSGTSSAAVFDIGIPQGQTGAAGSGTGDMLKSTYDPANKNGQLAADSEVVKLTGSQTIAGTKSFSGIISVLGSIATGGGLRYLDNGTGRGDLGYSTYNDGTNPWGAAMEFYNSLHGSNPGYVNFFIGNSSGNARMQWVSHNGSNSYAAVAWLLQSGDLVLPTPGTGATSATTNGGTQTLTNKSLTSPTFTGTVTTPATFSSGGFTLTYPGASTTIVGRSTTDTLTNKSIALGSNTVTGTTAQFNTALTDGDFLTTNSTITATVALPAYLMIAGPGNWNLGPFSYFSGFSEGVAATYNNNLANGDYFEFKTWLSAGTYSSRMFFFKNSNSCIIECFIDGVSQYTVDAYQSTNGSATIATASIVIATSGYHTWRYQASGKNASSTAYRLSVFGLYIYTP